MPGHPVDGSTTALQWWDARQYVEAYRSGNNSLSTVLKSIVYLIYYYGTMARSPRLGAVSRWLYDRFQSIWGGLPFPRKAGKIAAGQATPRLDLDLKPGELVRVKSYEQILETLDSSAFNRGLSFDAELVPYCGKVFRVRTRIERFIDEKTGKMLKMKTPAVILDGAYCQSLYSGKRILCLSRRILVVARNLAGEGFGERRRSAGQEFKGACYARASENDRGRHPSVDVGEAARSGESASPPGSNRSSLHHELPGMEGLGEATGRATFHAAQAR